MSTIIACAQCGSARVWQLAWHECNGFDEVKHDEYDCENCGRTEIKRVEVHEDFDENLERAEV